MEAAGIGDEIEIVTDRRKAVERLLALIQRLNPLDRQLILAYMEGIEAESIGELQAFQRRMSGPSFTESNLSWLNNFVQEAIMPEDFSPENLRNLWQDIPANQVQISPEELRKRLKKTRAKVHWRTIIGLLVALIIIAYFGVFLFAFPNLVQRIGSVLTIAGASYMVYQLLRQRPATLPSDFGKFTGIEFYRTELERQRDFHRGAWFWSRLLICLPGPLVFYFGFAQADPAVAPIMEVESAVVLALAVLAVPLNLRLARKYQRQIDALNECQADSPIQQKSLERN